MAGEDYTFSTVLATPGSPEFAHVVLEKLKQIMERFGKMEGSVGTPKFYSAINANSNQINNLSDPRLPLDALNLRTADSRYQLKSASQSTSTTIVNTSITSDLTLYAETPSGTVNGVNTTFTLSRAPKNSDYLLLTLNGLGQTVSDDFTLSAETISMSVAPDNSVSPADSLYAVYWA